MVDLFATYPNMNFYQVSDLQDILDEMRITQDGHRFLALAKQYVELQALVIENPALAGT